nr:hypothetical protein HGMM_F02E06C22 [uncultured Acetothermia bacterium]
MTYQEYWQIMFEVYNIARQQGQAGFAIWNTSQILSLAGFPELTQGELQGLWESFDAVASGSLPPEVVQAVEILRTILPEQLQEWLWALVIAEREGRFEEEYAYLVPLGLDRYIQALQLLYSLEEQQAKEMLRDYVEVLARTPGRSWEEVISELQQGGEYDKALAIYEAWFRSQGFPPDQARKKAEEQARLFFFAYAKALAKTGSDADQFERDVNTVLDYLLGLLGNPSKAGQLLNQLLSVLQEISKEQALIQNKALIRTLAQGIIEGWGVENIRQSILVKDKNTGIEKRVVVDIILRDQDYWLEGAQRMVDALFLVNFFTCTGSCDQYGGHIFEWFIAVAAGIDSLLQQYGANFGIIAGLIVDPVNYDQIDEFIFNLALELHNSSAAVFVVWTSPDGQVHFVCIGGGCQQMSAAQRRRHACLIAGKPRNCGAQEINIAKVGPISPKPILPVRITP